MNVHIRKFGPKMRRIKTIKGDGTCGTIKRLWYGLDLIGSVAGTCEHGNKFFGSIQEGEFSDKLGDYQLLTKVSEVKNVNAECGC